MSYHDLSLRERLTEGQLDRWADAMDQYDSRRKVRYGNSWFVNSDWPGGGNGTAASPFSSIYNALNSASASGDDMLYFKQTSTPYQTSVPGFIVVLNKPMTLRAMRGDGTGVWLR
ncbi:MAG: hypothetical protein JNJ57_02115 [Saprospiraceae bacterium]|nr:hypothetical protein [Saprospiraceae bacterium]